MENLSRTANLDLIKGVTNLVDIPHKDLSTNHPALLHQMNPYHTKHGLTELLTTLHWNLQVLYGGDNDSQL